MILTGPTLGSGILPELITLIREVGKGLELTGLGHSSVQFSSVAQSCLTFCDPMNHSTPGLPVHHQLPEFTQTHVHRVSDAIQPSRPRLSPSPPAPNPSSIKVFSNESTLRMRWPKFWSFSFSIIPSKEYFSLTIHIVVLLDMQPWWGFSLSVVSESCDPIDCSLPGSSVHGISQA